MDLNYLIPIRQKIENLQLELGKKLDHYFGAKFYGKSNSDITKTMCFNPVEDYREKGFLSATTVQKPEVNFFNLFTRRPNLHSNISLKLYEVNSTIFKTCLFWHIRPESFANSFYN